MSKRLDKRRNPPIHADIVARWDDVLKEGLPKEDRKSLYEKYLTPKNCVQYEPPILNKEVKASLSEPIITRDKRIANKQKRCQFV